MNRHDSFRKENEAFTIDLSLTATFAKKRETISPYYSLGGKKRILDLLKVISANQIPDMIYPIRLSFLLV